MKKLKFLIPLLIVALVFSSCEEDDNSIDISSLSITGVAASRSNLSSLVAALERTELDNILRGSGEFTVLAPTDVAFNTFLEANGFNSLTDVPDALLKQVLENHVISGRLRSGDLSTGYANTLAESDASGTNMSIYIDTSDGVTFNGISSVREENIETANGVIHIVDEVIALPTVVTFATADPNLSTLVAALTRNDLTTNFVEILSRANGTEPAPFTVFAPVNSAFVNLLEELEINALSQIDEPTLNTTLTYHVIGGTNALDSSLSDNLSLPTLGGTITANVTGGATLTDANGRISRIIATNIQANNGVIHTINEVILPPL